MNLKNKTCPALGVLAIAVTLAGCATSSKIMEADDGTYVISAYALQVRGGASGATNLAFEDATRFCQQKGLRAQLVNSNEQDIHQRNYSNTRDARGRRQTQITNTTAGRSEVRFRCES